MRQSPKLPNRSLVAVGLLGSIVVGVATGVAAWLVTRQAAAPPVGVVAASASPGPTPAVGGTWVSPGAGATVTQGTVVLSAKPAVAPPGVKTAQILFRIAWGPTNKAACAATSAAGDGTWSCTADLWKLGVPLADVTLGFEVRDDQGRVVSDPDGTRTVKFWAPPPAPTRVEVAEVYDETADTFTYTVQWAYPADAPISGFRVYSAMVPTSDGPCGEGWDCGEPPPCPVPPFDASGPDDPVWRTVTAVASNARRVTYERPYGPAIACGDWVVAYNAAGSSAPVAPKP